MTRIGLAVRTSLTLDEMITLNSTLKRHAIGVATNKKTAAVQLG